MNQYTIEEQFATGNNKEIKIQGLGFLKECKNYYSSQPLIDPNTIMWVFDTISIGGFTITYNHRIKFNLLLSRHLFRGCPIPIILEDSISRMWVRKDCELIKEDSETHNFTLIKTSYERIYSNQENIWGFIAKLCASRGWVFFYHNNCFYIKNRSSELNTITSLDYNKISEYTAIKAKSSMEYDVIVIPDGEFYGGNGAGFGDIRRGSRLYIFTDRFNNPNNNTPFSGMSGAYGLYFPYNRWLKYISADNLNTIIAIYEDRTYGYGGTNYTFSTPEILNINGGDTGNQGWVYDVSNGVNRPHSRSGDTGIGDTDVYFKGNYGNCIYSILPNGKKQTYIDYAKTSTFRNNFLKYLNQKDSRKLKIKYNGIILEPLSLFQITNTINDDLNGIWSLNNLKIDFKTESTELELQLKLD